MTAESSALDRELGKSLPAELAGLPAEVLERLAGLVHAARAQQAEELDTTMREFVGQLPIMVRGPVKKVLGV